MSSITKTTITCVTCRKQVSAKNSRTTCVASHVSCISCFNAWAMGRDQCVSGTDDECIGCPRCEELEFSDYLFVKKEHVGTPSEKSGRSVETERDEDGNLHGVEKVYYNGILVSWKEFKHGVEDGVRRTWYRNGNLQCIQQYKNGRLNGREMCFSRDCTPQMHTQYLNGIENGLRTEYGDDGRLISRLRYENDRVVEVLFGDSEPMYM